MKTYIDESGNFTIPPEGKIYTCCVGALVIPESEENLIFNNFKVLKRQWGDKNSEFKGSKLSESQVNDVIRMLSYTDCTFFASIVDMSLEEEEEVNFHKSKQAEKFLVDLEKMQHQSMKVDLQDVERRIKALSGPNYIQMQILTSLIEKVKRNAVLYYVQRYPDILETFEWIIDAKNKNITEYEKLWKKVVCGFLQTQSLREPTIACLDFDYSYMEKFLMEIPAYLQEQGAFKGNNNRRGYDLKKIMENLRFVDSASDLGVQLADILTTTVRRACNGTLQQSGWKNLGKLCVQKAVDENYVFDLLAFSEVASKVRRPYYGFLVSTSDLAKQMLL